MAFSQGTSIGVSSLTLPITPFIASTADAFVADPISLQSELNNPANIASHGCYRSIFSHTSWFQDTQTEYLAFLAPFQIGSFSLSIISTSIDGIEIREIPGPAQGTFDYQSTIFQLTYGTEITQSIHIGLASKYIYEKIFVDDAIGYGFDMGLIYSPSIDGLTFGCSILDIGHMQAFQKRDSNLPTHTQIGGTYSFTYESFRIRIASSISNTFKTGISHLHFGTDAWYNNVFGIRIGYKTNNDLIRLTAGIAFQYSILEIDYAYVPFFQQFGNGHIISVGFSL